MRTDRIGRSAMGDPDDWMEHAACRNFPTALFFPAEHDDDQTSGDNEIAKKICSECPVQAPCRAAQIDEPYGVRGLLTAEERGFRPRGRLSGTTITGLGSAVAAILRNHPDEEFTADSMNLLLLDVTGRRWPRNSVNAALLREHRAGTASRRRRDDKILAYRLNQET